MKKFKFTSDAVGWVVPLVFISIMVILLFTVRIIHIEGKSMEPTLTAGDVLLAVRDSTPEAGDVVVLYHSDKWLVKRVVAVAGETVPADVCSVPYWTDDPAPAVVPEGYVFVAGDNRGNSLDSRKESFGLIPVDSIWGRIVFNLGNSLGPVTLPKNWLGNF